VSTSPTPSAGPPSALLRFMQAYMRFSIEDMTSLLKRHELSMPQLGALQLLRAEGAQSVSAVAEHLNLSRTATSHLVERVVRKGLVHREEDPEDRRQKRITLSDRGQELIAEIHARAAATMEALLEPVPESKRDALDRAMHDVVTELERAAAEASTPKETP